MYSGENDASPAHTSLFRPCSLGFVTWWALRQEDWTGCRWSSKPWAPGSLLSAWWRPHRLAHEAGRRLRVTSVSGSSGPCFHSGHVIDVCVFEYGFGVHPCFFFESSGKFTTMISSRTFFFSLYFPFGISTYSSLLVVVIVSISHSLFDPSCSSKSFLLQHVRCCVKIIKF